MNGRNDRNQGLTIKANDLTRLTWQQQLQGGFSNRKELLAYLEINESLVSSDSLIGKNQFRLKVPQSFALRMQKGDINDPLLKQVLPVSEENIVLPGFSQDPVGDKAALKTPILIHKYHGRALLLISTSCPIHCRFCFRKEFPYSTSRFNEKSLNTSLDYLRGHKEISEVILSGGDPLMLDNQRIAQLVTQLSGIKHIKRVRIHSRMPIVLPARIDMDLIAKLKESGLQIIFVLHTNHANEINAEVATSVNKLKEAGFTLLNQSVLLKNINNTVAALSELSERLFAVGILPYYLHLLDRTIGTHHFEVCESEGKQLVENLRKILPGYLVPRLAREEAGKSSKTIIL